MLRCSLLTAALVSIAGVVAPAPAAVVTYINSDVGANSTDPRPNSDAAAAAFDTAAGALGPVSVITFESAPVGTYTSLTVAPGVTLTGTDFTGDTGGQSIRNSPFGTPDRLFGYNTTAGGENFAFVNGGFITFTFDTPIQAFGAYLSGVQLVGETIQFSDGTSQTVEIPFLNGGGVAFVGFTDAGKQIVSVTIDTRTQANPLGDFIGVDDVRYVSSTAAVPEPSTFALAGAGGLSLAGLIRRRRRA